MTHTPPSVCAAMLPECAHRFRALESQVKEIDTRQRDDRTSIAVLRTQVALGAALGSIFGGGLVTLFARLLKF